MTTAEIQVGDTVRPSKRHGLLQGCSGKVVGIVRNDSQTLFIVEMFGINGSKFEVILRHEDFEKVTP